MIKEFVVARLKGESLEKYLKLMEKADIETFEKQMNKTSFTDK